MRTCTSTLTPSTSVAPCRRRYPTPHISQRSLCNRVSIEALQLYATSAVLMWDWPWRSMTGCSEKCRGFFMVVVYLAKLVGMVMFGLVIMHLTRMSIAGVGDVCIFTTYARMVLMLCAVQFENNFDEARRT